jgi:hypothetical protein
MMRDPMSDVVTSATTMWRLSGSQAMERVRIPSGDGS